LNMVQRVVADAAAALCTATRVLFSLMPGHLRLPAFLVMMMGAVVFVRFPSSSARSSVLDSDVFDSTRRACLGAGSATGRRPAALENTSADAASRLEIVAVLLECFF
jgi:hypothetical protein